MSNKLEDLMAKVYGLATRIIDKVISARFLVTVLLATTLCYAVKESFRIVGLTGGEGEIIAFRKEIFMYVRGMFSGIVGSVITSYFSRQDRKVLPTDTPEA
jgi:hypothetical protein